MKRAAKLLVFVLCIGFTLASIVNVFFDNYEVEQMSKNTACEAAAQAKAAKSGAPPAAKSGAPPAAKPGAPAPAAPDDCRMTMTRMSRTPFSQSFEWDGMNSLRRVRCTRSLIFVGDYSCVTE
jgi:hypothetical protein